MANDKKAVVAIAKEPTVQESVTKVFDLLGGVTNMIKRGETVILKPNAGHAEGPDKLYVQALKHFVQLSAKLRKLSLQESLLQNQQLSAVIQWNVSKYPVRLM